MPHKNADTTPKDTPQPNKNNDSPTVGSMKALQDRLKQLEKEAEHQQEAERIYKERNSLIEELITPKVHEEPIKVPLDAWLKIIESEEISSSDKEEETREEQIVRYQGILMKLNSKLYGTEPLEEKPPVLTKELNTLVQQKLPQKLPDPGLFLILCTIGTITIDKALCDLRSSINLMPLFVMERLGIFEVQAARISLEMPDKLM
ncbi:uncharacterized protein LOC130949665 [Arachis stenosperma]|uniref:uncharacterized protein LOC130949665 n=1 Tax=Arachis stenosperma TaxID=217475 RepID=UPI0025AC9BEA|nr:uncharacterized protein LOC130949665 [Arachis stenosperma]